MARLKERTEDTKGMCKELDDFVAAVAQRAEANGIDKGRAEGENRGKKYMAIKLYEKGTSVEDISDIADVPVAEVEAWLNLQTV